MSHLQQVLADAKSEIVSLRRQNEILSAKMYVFDQCMCLLHSCPASGNQSQLSVDVVYQLEKELEKLKTE